MTESNKLFRAAVAGTVLSSALALSPMLVAQTAPPQSQQRNLPAPRYQSPGVAPVQAPAPQYQLPPTQAITPNATVVEDVIVRVNDNIISRSDLERAQAQLQQELAQRGNTSDPAERERNLLRDLIDQQLLLSKGKELGLNPDAEVVRRLDEIRKQNNFASMEDLERAARQQGVSFEDLKANIRNSIITGEVVRDEVGRTVSQRMTRAEEQKYYDAHKADFVQPEQVRLSEILVPTAANADDTQIAAAQQTSQGLYDKLKGGADFAALAKSSSGGPTAAQGGDLGQFKRGTLAPVLEQKTFALPVGSYTEPTRTRQGFVILKATEHQQAGAPPMEQIESDIQNAMYQDEIQPALREYLTKLREEAYLDLRTGFVDTGASAKESKPVFTAYVPPAPKKKAAAKQRLDSGASGGRLAQTKGNAAAPTATPAVQQLDKNGKPKKVRREKVRYGQAPRAALPEAAGTETAATDSTNAAAPGTQISPLEASTNTVAANTAPPDADPLALKVPSQRKTRYASREPEVKAKKAEVKQAKVEDKRRATPVAATTEEKSDKTVQSGALGLNGTTSKKQKKKRQKGEAKDRLQEQAPQQKAPLQDNGLPDRLHQVNGPTSGATVPNTASQSDTQAPSKKSSDATTLAPVTQPAPGDTLPSQTPTTPGAATTPTNNDNTSTPQTNVQPR